MHIYETNVWYNVNSFDKRSTSSLVGDHLNINLIPD